MRLWPFKLEIRQLSGGPSGVNSYITDLDTYYATGGQADVHQTAAVEFALGQIGRAFARAEPVPAVPALTSQILSMIARQTMATGNAVLEIGRTGRLLPVATYSVIGGVDPDTWRYTIRQQRPNGEDPLDLDSLPARNVPATGMVHVRYMPSFEAPWIGVSPLRRAGVTADTLAEIEISMKYDSSLPTGGLIPQPDGASPQAINQAQTALTTGKGGIALIETTAAGFGQGKEAAPKGDWDQKRFGPNIPASSIEAREKAGEFLMDAMGVPSSLHRSNGGALRESNRHFLTGTVKALAALIEEELSEKLERPIRLYFPQAFESDMVARGRTLKSLVDTGSPPREAGKLIGLPEAALAGRKSRPNRPNLCCPIS